MEPKNIPLIVDGKDIIAEIIFKEDGAMVAITPICNAIGVKPDRQAQKLQGDPKFTGTHMWGRGTDGKQREFFCLPVDQVVPWLYTINSNKVKKGEVRENLLRFQLHLGKELSAVAKGDVSIARTEKLEKQVSELIKQIAKLTDLVFSQQETINNMKQAEAHKTRARVIRRSAAGKELAASKADKKAEKLLH
jgi:hypothetical protein